DRYAFIIADLTEAENILPEAYAVTTDYPTARIRANKWAAASLLARVYLYTKDYTKAAEKAAAVIGSGMYSLETDLNNVFLTSSNEAVLQFMAGDFYNTTEGLYFNQAFDFVEPSFLIHPDLLSSFPADDKRLASWTKTVSVNSASYTFPFKYKIRIGSAPFQEYNMVIRLAELYLIKAEALALKNDIEASATELKVVRERAGLTQFPADISQQDLLDSIAVERRREFFGEWGHRWLDLKRTGKVNDVLLPLKSATWNMNDTLYPIPFYEIQTNFNLVQNQGYQ
ncbi:MAG: RagB/SusD family nutrient uptake outer membrane protein, partial [Chitinophagaceae bacterium]|nr:RagB/SusD family nutrient uptake outer membrane protein [Chitinophagaceae bacterium]